jgi:hypothetical protein
VRHLPLTITVPLAGALITYAICLMFALKARASARRSLAQAGELEEKLLAVRQDCGQLAERLRDQAERITRLEEQARCAAIKDEADLIAGLSAPAKPSITERRHRVLSLARRGLDVETIASTLGAPHGEVELIIELNNATLGAMR